VVAATALPLSPPEGAHLFLTTRQGTVKRVALSDLPGVTTEAFTVIGVDDDELGWVTVTQGADEVLLLSAAGQTIRFAEEEVRAMGLPAGGVMGIKLKDKHDRVTGFALVRPRSDLFTIASDGRAKRSPLSDYPTQGRYGQGVIGARLGSPDTFLAGGCVVQASDPVVLITEKGAAKTLLARNAPRMGRTTQGEEVIALRDGDIVINALAPREEEVEEQ
jgi:DNA gyrase subunit A